MPEVAMVMRILMYGLALFLASLLFLFFVSLANHIGRIFAKIGSGQVGSAQIGIMQLGPGEVRRHRLVSLSPVIPRLHSAPQYLQMFLIRDETTAVAVIVVRTVRKHKLFVEGFRCLQQNDGSI